MNDEIKVPIKKIDFPNYGVIQSVLPQSIVNQLNDYIDIAKNKDETHNKKLAGNISLSLELFDTKNIIFPFVMLLMKQYEEIYSKPFRLLATNKNYHAELQSLWVNFQYQNEFNPMHDHTGTYSFVIWLKIPTNYKEQSNKSIAKNSSNPDVISNFSLSYTDVFGKIRELLFGMDKNREGQILFFPSQINHSVYPFYDEGDARISVSGNIGLVEA
tara:strand:+ start:61 stop:705 length:645 start_codon:yes stop_codon:yes gene_type:complete